MLARCPGDVPAFIVLGRAVIPMTSADWTDTLGACGPKVALLHLISNDITLKLTSIDIRISGNV